MSKKKYHKGFYEVDGKKFDIDDREPIVINDVEDLKHLEEASVNNEPVVVEGELTPDGQELVKTLIEQGNKEYKQRVETLTKAKRKYQLTDREEEAIDFCINFLSQCVKNGEKALKDLREETKRTTS